MNKLVKIGLVALAFLISWKVGLIDTFVTPWLPREYQFRRLSAFTEEVGEELYKKVGVQWIGFGSHRFMETTWRPQLALNLVDGRQLTQEQVHDNLYEIMKIYWKRVKPYYYINQYAQQQVNENTPIKLSPEHLAVRLTFWDKEVNRPPLPYVAQAMVKEGKIYYYFLDPHTNKLGNPTIEDFDYKQISN